MSLGIDSHLQCDLAPDGCIRCSKIGQPCPGYRSQIDLHFRDETAAVIKKETKHRVRIATPSHPSLDAIRNASAKSQIVRYHDAHGPTSLLPTAKDQATAFFHTQILVGNKDCRDLSTTDDGTSKLMTAIGLAALSTMTHAPDKLRDAEIMYLAAVGDVRKRLASPESTKKEDVVFEVTLLGMFEMFAGRTASSISKWFIHTEGALALNNFEGEHGFMSNWRVRWFMWVSFEQ